MQAPDFSADWYRSITGWAHDMPSWTHPVAEVGTDAGLLLFAALFVLGWWRARDRDARSMGLALLAPAAMVSAYLVSEVSKSFLREERPCRAVAGAMNIAQCPAPGDWSFPSNHATIAAASAAAIVVAWRALAPLVLPLAAMMAFSRVYVGVHYPHDVAMGFVVGVVVAPLVALVLVRLAAPLVEMVRRMPVGVTLLGPPVGTPAPAAVPAGSGAPAPGTPNPYGAPASYGGQHRQGVRPPAPQHPPYPQGPQGGPGGYGPGPVGQGEPENPAAVTMPDVMTGIGRHRRPPS
ncbi:phosphatase PAP2 family protein [Actinomadura hibisca]|uniref:phosphatase PAP2 family protein n=1 Tax=Actinomadura hibisca TaxID=68565 RepID=UPI0009FEB729|nr:phosphatase PAP2 family protein [Actinomadura hibisca]